MHRPFESLLSRLKKLNIYSSSKTANNEYELQNELLSTRIFLVLYVSLILILTIYTSQVSVTHTVEVKQLSYDQYQVLKNQYSETLGCSCENVEIEYKLLFEIQPKYHQICSSQFIEDSWINYLDSAASIVVSDDFSYTGSIIFDGLASFCQIANESIVNDLEIFYSTQFLSDKFLDSLTFYQQINTIIQSFQTPTQLNNYQLFVLNQYFTRINQLRSSLLNEVYLYVHKSLSGWSTAQSFRIYSNGTCECNSLNQCTDPLTLQDHRNNSVTQSVFEIPGLLKGCYLIEAIRSSTLECLYNLSCITTIEEYLFATNMSRDIMIPLNESLNFQFNVSTTIDELLSKAMIDQWIQNVSHENYFEQCNVSSCTYSYVSKYSLIYMITTLIGLIGGLTKVLYFLVYFIVKFIRQRIHKENNEESVRLTISLIIQRIRQYNYFSNSSSNQNEIKQQIISTRLYFVLLIVSVIILLTYYSLIPVNISYHISSPTLEQYIDLEKKQNSNPTFICLCSKLAISYEKIIQINYVLHPVCYAQSLQQILIHYPMITVESTNDFRQVARTFFQSLIALCDLSVEHIKNNLNSFYSSILVTDTVLNNKTFQSKIDNIIDQFISSTTLSFVNNINFITIMEINNLIINDQETNFMYRWARDVSNAAFVPVFFRTIYYKNGSNRGQACDCFYETDCYKPMIIQYDLKAEGVVDVDNFFQGCLPSVGFSHTTLICLFNQSCLNSLLSVLNTSNGIALDPNDLNWKSFYPNTTIQELLNELFINQWNISSFYEDFYNECHPSSCMYTLVQRNSIWLILTALFSLIGGLLKIFQIVVPRFVAILFMVRARCYRKQNSNENATATFKISFQSIVNRLKQLNIFSSNDSAETDQHEKENQILSTRIFLILFIVSILILIIFLSQISVIKIVRYQNPSIEQYRLLSKKYSQGLTCSCQQIAIKKQIFVSLEPIFHQICQSFFVDTQFIILMENTLSKTIAIPGGDFRKLSGPIFRTITSFCQFSSMTINRKLENFNDSSFISTDLISEEKLIEQIQTLTDLLVSDMEHSWFISLLIHRTTMHINNLMPIIGSTVSIQAPITNKSYLPVTMTSVIYKDSTECSCKRDPTCVTSMFIYNTTKSPFVQSFMIPGFYLGCYIVEGTLKSNLASLYNQTWIDEFLGITQFYYFNPDSINITALNATASSQYNPYTPIENITKHLMIENWNSSINYSAYYEQCHPTECTHTYTIKYDTVYIITTIIGLIGGLVTIFQLVIPRAVRLIRGYFYKRRQQTRVQVIMA